MWNFILISFTRLLSLLFLRRLLSSFSEPKQRNERKIAKILLDIISFSVLLKWKEGRMILWEKFEEEKVFIFRKQHREFQNYFIIFISFFIIHSHKNFFVLIKTSKISFFHFSSDTRMKSRKSLMATPCKVNLIFFSRCYIATKLSSFPSSLSFLRK